MSFFGKLFGTEKALTATIEAVSNGLDALVYTDEEKAGDAAKSRSEARGMFIEWVRNSQGQNLARRMLAVMIASTWLGQYAMVQVLTVASIWQEEVMAGKLEASAAIIAESAQSMNGAMMLILGFYFAAPHLGKIAEGAIAKFGK